MCCCYMSLTTRVVLLSINPHVLTWAHPHEKGTSMFVEAFHTFLPLAEILLYVDHGCFPWCMWVLFMKSIFWRIVRIIAGVQTVTCPHITVFTVYPPVETLLVGNCLWAQGLFLHFWFLVCSNPESQSQLALVQHSFWQGPLRSRRLSGLSYAFWLNGSKRTC